MTTPLERINFRRALLLLKKHIDTAVQCGLFDDINDREVQRRYTQEFVNVVQPMLPKHVLEVDQNDPTVVHVRDKE